MESRETNPPDKHPSDLPRGVDPVAGHLREIAVNLVWMDQYRLNIEHYLKNDPSGVESEMVYLHDAIDDAIKHIRRLTELLLAGATIDPKKRIPRDLEIPPKRGA